MLCGFLMMLSFKCRTSPEVGVTKEESIEIVVDFPAPFGPSRPTISPFSKNILIPCAANFCLYFFDKSTISNIPSISFITKIPNKNTAENNRSIQQTSSLKHILILNEVLLYIFIIDFYIYLHHYRTSLVLTKN